MNSWKEKININDLPEHIAIIMDGNGRWAKANGKPRVFGHMNGVKAVRQVTEAATELGVKYLTLYTFSTENWNRPEEEVTALMKLLVQTIEQETNTLIKNNIRLTVIGDINRLPKPVRDKLTECIERTSTNTRTTLNLAISYSSRWEIVEMARQLAKDAKDGIINPEKIDEDTISSHLTTKDMPDPEILIRTGGEYRISNFLLWQIAYTELYYTPIMWPDFNKENLYEIIANFQTRERRFGMTGEQVENK